MKKYFLCLLLFLYASKIYAFEYEYTPWFDHYPQGVEEFRIESEERYLWYKEENGETIKTEEYFKELDGYIKIEESVKTFYRVLNSKEVYVDSKGNLVTDPHSCIKTRCKVLKLVPYTENEENNNPNTKDDIDYYISLFIGSLSIIILNTKKII